MAETELILVALCFSPQVSHGNIGRDQQGEATGK